MATKYANARQRARVTAEAAGALYQDHQSVDIADLDLDTLAVGDTIQIALVPAGHALVPELSAVSIPEIDSDATATGKASLGTSDAAASLLAAASVGAPISKSIGDLLTPSDTVGSADADTPILLTITAVMATQASTGTISTKLVLRAWDEAIDG